MGFGDNKLGTKYNEVTQYYKWLCDDVNEWVLSHQVTDHTMNVSILTLNCNGLRNKLKRKAIFSLLKKQTRQI